MLSPPLRSRRPWRPSVRPARTGSNSPSTRTRCAKPSTKDSSWTCWRTTRPTRLTTSSPRPVHVSIRNWTPPRAGRR
ncbi:hypothetical protein ACFFX0_25680 [Citricoccus parietis]|uniref:Uncharacterized protein n=1 Tax=Citricoccus parietis TaxID=592307 RepID=A0ABV5G624_9MICC